MNEILFGQFLVKRNIYTAASEGSKICGNPIDGVCAEAGNVTRLFTVCGKVCAKGINAVYKSLVGQAVDFVPDLIFVNNFLRALLERKCYHFLHIGNHRHVIVVVFYNGHISLLPFRLNSG